MKKVEEDYISFVGLLKGLWLRRRTMIKIVLVFILIGLFVAIFSRNEYSSSVKFLSQTSSSAKLGGNWSGLAALVGINLNASTEAGEIPANIYPKIINSVPFQRQLMETKLKFKGIDSAITFKKYYTEIAKPDVVSIVQKYTIGLPMTIIKLFKSDEDEGNRRLNDSLIYVSKKEERLQNILKENLLFSIDETDGVISIAATMPEPVPAAQLAQRAQGLLQKEILAYRIAKAQDQLNFIDKQFDREEVNYKTAQTRLAAYRDRNLFNVTQLSQVEMQRLQSDYDLSYSVFSELQRQQVAQNIQVKKDTPIFTTVNPATVPTEPVAPNRIKIMLISLFLGFFVAISWGLAKDFFIKFKTKWQSIE